jgi:hypothetical protein
LIRIAIQVYSTTAVAADLVPSRQKRLKEAATLLHKCRPRRLKDSATHIHVNRCFRNKLRIHDALPISLKKAIFLSEFLVLVSYSPSPLRTILFHACAFLIDPSPCFLHISLHMPELSRRFLLRAALVLADPVDLTLLFGHELLPYRKLLLLECLAAPLCVAPLLPNFRLRSFEPADER